MKNNCTGWKDVFKFTLFQNFKTKSIKIATIIICLIAILVIPVVSLINDDGNKDTDTTIKKVYVADYTGLNLAENIETLKSDKYYQKDQVKLYCDIEYSDVTDTLPEYSEDTELKDIYKFDKEDTGVYLQLTYFDQEFDVNVIYSKDAKVDEDDIEDYRDFLDENFKDVLLNSQNLTDSQKLVANSHETINVYDKSEDVSNPVSQPDDTENINNPEFKVIYGILMITLFMLTFGGERIAMSIVTEKTSKVMEYLMTSIKPMALVIGKLFASLLTVVIQFACIGLSLLISTVFTGYYIVGEGKKFIMPTVVKDVVGKNIDINPSPVGIIIGIVVLVCGFIFFGMIAAMAGAAVSKIEDVSEGVKMYTILLIVGAYFAIFVVSGHYYAGSSIIKYICVLLPISCPFIATGLLITKNLSIVFGLICVVIMIASDIIILKFVSNVYESMIYYNGNTLKFKDILKISKQNKVTDSNRKETM